MPPGESTRITVLYAFKHALTHEVAYGGVLQDRRRALHARILEAMERLYADHLSDQVERLAQHAFRGEVWNKALAFLKQAFENADMRSAHREAVMLFEQGLEALRHLPESRDTVEWAADVRARLQGVLLALGDPEQMLDNLQQRIPLAEALGDQSRLARIYASMPYGMSSSRCSYVSIGMLVKPASLVAELPTVLIFILIVTFGKFIIWSGIVRFAGYGSGTVILAGLGLTQIGEFSYILASVGRAHNLVNAPIYDAILATSLVTILTNALVFRRTPVWVRKFLEQ